MIVLGIVIHTSRRAIFAEAAGTLTGVELEWIEYEYELDIRESVQALLARRHLDGLLVGPVPYAACRDLLPDGLEVEVLEPAGLDLALAFFRATARGWKPTPVSVDTFEPGVVAEVAQALGLDADEIGCLPYEAQQGAEEIVDFHRRFLDRAGGGYIISVRTAVVRQLDGIVPVLNGAPVPSTIRAQLHGLALRVQSRRADALRFAAGVFQVAGPDGPVDVERSRLGLMHLLVNTPEFAGAWVEDRGLRGVVVFAHVALFQRVTHEWTSVPALRHAGDTLGIRVAAGFGIGASARTCVQLAEQAAGRAERDDPPCAYLIEDGGVIIGPMGPGRSPLLFTYREHGEHLDGLAREAGLSPATLSRLAAIEHTSAGRPLSPRDLADSLGITDSSGRRLLRKLGASGLVTPVGSAQPHRNGRPARLYRLNIVDAITRGV